MSNINNIDELVSKAKAKLSSDENSTQEDIYADMKDEQENDRSFSIKYSPDIEQQDNINIEYSSNNIEEDYIDVSDTQIFENGPRLSEVELWKKQFSKERIYHVQILDKHFVFRTLNRYEYKQIVALENIDALQREEVICTTCTLFPYSYNFKKMAKEDSGYPSTLAQIIMENSGFTKDYAIEVL